jgi:hypothetical protein
LPANVEPWSPDSSSSSSACGSRQCQRSTAGAKMGCLGPKYLLAETPSHAAAPAPIPKCLRSMHALPWSHPNMPNMQAPGMLVQSAACLLSITTPACTQKLQP